MHTNVAYHKTNRRTWITENQRQMVATGSLKSLPDRLINPEEYEEDLTDPVTVYIKTNTSGHFSN